MLLKMEMDSVKLVMMTVSTIRLEGWGHFRGWNICFLCWSGAKHGRLLIDSLEIFLSACNGVLSATVNRWNG